MIPRLLASLALICCSCLEERPGQRPAVTPRSHGPFRVRGNRIADANGRTFLIRGTRVAVLKIDELNENSSAAGFGALSATSFATIRQRLNMNAVRLPLDAREYARNPDYRARSRRVVARANATELLVILEAAGESEENFWKLLASDFAKAADVFFAAPTTGSAKAIRAAGAAQPVVLPYDSIQVPGTIHEYRPHYGSFRTSAADWGVLARESAQSPVIADGLDPQLDTTSRECKSFPADPGDAERLVANVLTWLDAHAVSWTISSFTEGKLVSDFSYYGGTKLNAGWTCGEPDGAGLGLSLLSHLWDTQPLGLFSVSHSRGGLILARGGLATGYGPILAEREMKAAGSPLPLVLGNVSVRVTDSRGVKRLAPLLYTGAGWAFIDFVVPDDCATGPAKVEVVRTDGSASKSMVLIADVSPALLTDDGRGPAVGSVTQNGRSYSARKCTSDRCAAVGIPVAASGSTTVSLVGSGFRHAHRFDARVGGMSVPVVSAGAAREPGNDEITIRLPEWLRGKGEMDLSLIADDELSNVVRIRCD